MRTKYSLLPKLMSLVLLFLSQLCFSQGRSVEMSDVMRSNGKIYVVLSIILLIFVGFTIYLIVTDVKLRDLEKEVKINK